MSTEIRNASDDQDLRTGVTSDTNANQSDGIFACVSRWPKVILLLLALACLLPFGGKALHMDDPLFIWAAKQITRHPFDPYGFSVVWYGNRMPMSEVTQ